MMEGVVVSPAAEGPQASRTRLRTGEILLRDTSLTPAQLEHCLEQQRQLEAMGQHVMLGEIILTNKYCTRRQVERAVSESKDLQAAEVPDDVRREFSIFVHGMKNGVLYVSPAKTFSAAERSRLHSRLSHLGIKSIQTQIMDKKDVLKSLQSEVSAVRSALVKNIKSLNHDFSDGQVLFQVIQGLFIEAVEERASDIHIMKDRDPISCTIHYRIDGKRQFKYLLSPGAMGALAVRLKALANMDISDSKVSADGRIPFVYNRRNVDLRISTIPVFAGEKIVIRLLDPDRLQPIGELFAAYPHVLHNLRRLIELKVKTGGLILITGPTGAGKTTTLHGALTEMDRCGLNIMMTEDPVEYTVHGLCQTPVNELTGMSFSNALRYQVRQDPDVIGVGEMRDTATVEAGLRSVESGHTVLATLHTIGCAETIERIRGMIPADYKVSGTFVLANFLKAVLNQRLVHKLCDCREMYQIKDLRSSHITTHICDVSEADDAAIYENVDIQVFMEQCDAVFAIAGMQPEETVALAKGCPKCKGSGYHGRTLVLEAAFFPADVRLRGEMRDRLSTNDAEFSADALLKLPGVEYMPVLDSVKELLRSGVIDPVTAYDLLELKKEYVADGGILHSTPAA